MSDLPFGFGPSDSDDSRNPGSGSGPAAPVPGARGPVGLGAQGTVRGRRRWPRWRRWLRPGPARTDADAARADAPQSVRSGGGRRPREIQARRADGPPAARRQGLAEADGRAAPATEESVRLAEHWLEDATTLPSGTSTVTVWSPRVGRHDHAHLAAPCDPVAQRVAGAWVEGLPAEAREMAGPMLGMISQVGGMAFGSQLGAALGQLAGEVLTSSDVGLPLGPRGHRGAAAGAVARFTEGLDRPASEVLVFLAAREAAHHRLFGHVPWLRQRLSPPSRSSRTASPSTPRGSRSSPATSTRRTPPRWSRPCPRGCSSRRPPKRRRRRCAGSRPCSRSSRARWTSSSPRPSASASPGRPRCAELRRRRASGGPAEATFATWSGWSCVPAGCATPQSCGAARRRARRRRPRRGLGAPRPPADRRGPRRPDLLRRGRTSPPRARARAGAGPSRPRRPDRPPRGGDARRAGGGFSPPDDGRPTAGRRATRTPTDRTRRRAEPRAQSSESGSVPASASPPISRPAPAERPSR